MIDSATGDIFVATGNGQWDGRRNWGDATLELGPDAATLLGNYTPVNTEALDARDADLGSTSPVLLGGGMVAQGGKDGSIRLLDWRQMRSTEPHKGRETQMLSTPSGTDLFTAPAVLHTSGTTWFLAADGGGTAAWTFASGRLSPVWKNGNAGTSPVIAGGLVYVYDPGGDLRVYQLETGRELEHLSSGRGHWNSPIVVDGIIALPEGNANSHRTNGVLNIYRLP